jgi:hypothetical protein
MKADELINILLKHSNTNNVALGDIEVKFRADYDSDVEIINKCHEDLFNEHGDLESVCLMSNDEDK